MATKNQLALLLLICTVTALFIQPAMGQKDALRWGKRGSELSDDYVENPRTFQRYHHDDDYSLLSKNEKEYSGLFGIYRKRKDWVGYF